MGVISGEGGAVNGESTVELWEVHDLSEPEETVASNTNFGVDQGCGVKDWYGWYTSKVHTSARFPGEGFTFTGNRGNNKGFSGVAICDAIQVAAEIERGRYIQCLTRFSCNGAPTHGAAAVSDTTDPDPPCSQGMGVKLDGAAVGEVASWQFTIQARNKVRVTGATSGYRFRTAGPITGQFQYKFYYDDPAVLPAKDSIYVVRFDVTASTYWEWTWGKITRIEEHWEPGSSEPPYAIVRGVFKPFSGTSTGSIITPAGTTKWPSE
jgi:hypothetical protein